jgi:predicted porin
MQKKIIALAIASALTVPAMAFADVTVTGQINMSVDVKNDGGSPSASTNRLTDNQSRLIFKGSEDLGSGMSAIFQLDARFTADDGQIAAKNTQKTTATTVYYTTSQTKTTASLFSGNTFLGLASDTMGSLKVGNLDTPFKSSTRGLDVFYDVAGDNRTGLGGLLGGGHDLRLSNSIVYNSPNMSGFSVAVGSEFGAETAAANTTKGSEYSLAGMYSMNGIYATLAYQSIKVGDANTGDLGAGDTVTNTGISGLVSGDETKSLRLGGGYTMDQITVNAVFEQPKTTSAGIESKNTNFYLGGKFAISGTDSVRAAYTKHGETDAGGVKQGDGANQIAIGYAHDMSKMTSVYATYVKTSADGTAADPSVISFGMKHAF